MARCCRYLSSGLWTEVYGDEVGVRTAEVLNVLGFIGGRDLLPDSGGTAKLVAYAPGLPETAEQATRSDPDSVARRCARNNYITALSRVNIQIAR